MFNTIYKTYTKNDDGTYNYHITTTLRHELKYNNIKLNVSFINKYLDGLDHNVFF